MREFILNFVKKSEGCKFSELSFASSRYCSYDELISAVNFLILEKELIEVKYFLKDQHSERMGILLPKDTSIKINGS